MKLELRRNRDFWAGFMFFGFGTVAILIARNYRFGTTLRMGPGYFPILMGGILILFGIYIMIKGLHKKMKIEGNWSVRSLTLLPLSMILFGIVMTKAGFIPALAVLGFVSAASGREFKWGEVLLLTTFLGMLSVALFIWGLGLPYPLINRF
jgi:hypothetical protein